jgi:hypothetical protein
MSPLQALTIFVGIPLLVYAVVAIFVYAPARARGPKYRPGLSWWAEPVWIGGVDLPAVATAEPLTEAGGCSARW